MVFSSKYLGVTGDGKLSWIHHLAEITAKATKTLGLIKPRTCECRDLKEMSGELVG